MIKVGIVFKQVDIMKVLIQDHFINIFLKLSHQY